MKTVLIVGKDGQLARCIYDIEKQYKDFKFIYTDSKALDITNKEQIETVLKKTEILIIVLIVRPIQL